MRRKEVNLQSPLRIVDRAIRGGLGKGHLGVILAPPGVGKSACLVQLGLDALMREKPVLHVAVGQSVEHVAASYDARFDDLAELVNLADRGGVRASVSHRRLIWSVAEGALGAQGLDDALAVFERHFGRGPGAILVDDFDWSGAGCAASVAALKASASRAGAELWMTARDPGGGELHRAASVDALPADCYELADVLFFLAPRGRHARLTLVKDFEREPVADVPLVLEAGTLRLLRAGDATASTELDPQSFTLVASGSAGAEEEFGACAERWDVQEVNFTCAGRREVARTRGLVELSEDELGVGEVSAAYVKARLHRTFQDPGVVGRVLQLIWHQVSAAGEVFFVGEINPDNTAHGGTGWAVELARQWGKPIHLFDQQRKAWFRWNDQEWAAEPPPVVTALKFAGTGTRSLSDDGRAAIRALFQRSFGPVDCATE